MRTSVSFLGLGVFTVVFLLGSAIFAGQPLSPWKLGVTEEGTNRRGVLLQTEYSQNVSPWRLIGKTSGRSERYLSLRINDRTGEELNLRGRSLSTGLSFGQRQPITALGNALQVGNMSQAAIELEFRFATPSVERRPAATRSPASVRRDR